MIKRFGNWCFATHGHELLGAEKGNYVLFADYERELSAANQSRDEWVALYTRTKQELAAAQAALATARAIERERCAKIADEYPDTLLSIGIPGSGKFKPASKVAQLIRALVDTP